MFTRSHQKQPKLPLKRVTVSVVPTHCTSVSTTRAPYSLLKMQVRIYRVCSNYSRSRRSQFSRSWSHLQIFGRRCLTVKMDVERLHTLPHCSLCSVSEVWTHFVAYQLIIQYSCCEASNNAIRSYFTVKQRDLPELEKVASSSVTEAVRPEVKRTIGMKCATDEEGNSIESKREQRYII